MKNLGPSFSSRPVLRIDLKTLKENYKALQTKVGRTVHVAAAVKADAYGLGAERVSKALYGAGCRTYFVATAGEGKIVREAIGDNASIYVLNGPAPRDLTLYFGFNLKPVINSLTQAHIWAEAIKTVGQPPFSAIHIDTGLNRLGLTADEVIKINKNNKLTENLKLDLIMSHLACAPHSNHDFNPIQLKQFQQRASQFPMKTMSLCNTAGIYLGKSYHFQMVRPGIGLYGGQATTNPAHEITKSVVSLMAPVLQVKSVATDETIGYDASYKADKDRQIAIVGAGYADGIPFASSTQNNKPSGFATMQGRRVPILGRVSMDLTILDITNLKKKPRIGDWAEFLGENLQEDARNNGTHNYELLTRLSHRAKREYKQ